MYSVFVLPLPVNYLWTILGISVPKPSPILSPRPFPHYPQPHLTLSSSLIPVSFIIFLLYIAVNSSALGNGPGTLLVTIPDVKLTLFFGNDSRRKTHCYNVAVSVTERAAISCFII
ncbi:hypothetical protein OTU49_010462 [Cherax quadricarinatus]|uniref:Uncharacterized protein n=1 Tax=Cherax quadricarinatus TaxID=27406 RepID=A0AAW0WDH2_CHEQU